MTKQSVNTRMTHRALIERNTQTDTNPYGHAGPPEWTSHVAAQACFLYYRAINRGGEKVAVERTAVVEEAVLLAPIGADITERDRINGVQDRAGNVLLAGIQNIRTVQPIRRSHVEIVLSGVQ